MDDDTHAAGQDDDSMTDGNALMPGFVWQDCDRCGGIGTVAYDNCQACMGEGGRWIALSATQPPDESEKDHSHDEQRQH
ncbi:MAG TPA: hypothetical protein VJZ27_16405 [Aggregatilineales bacterium]|nr:hypothetical protein [Aggregatilineales bacterium]